MGNTVGSTSANFCNFFEKQEDSYILGLWCADKYFWSSSVGISNSDPALVKEFIEFFRNYLPKERLRLRIYLPDDSLKIDQDLLERVKQEHVKRKEAKKASQIGYHLYVNSRPFLRDFKKAEKDLANLEDPEMIKAYFAGRFDGDGSVNKNLKTDCRIVYKNEKSAEKDKKLIEKTDIKKVKVYEYKNAGTYCLYIYEEEAPKFMNYISPFLQKSYRS
mgnify:CR=1 FL=1